MKNKDICDTCGKTIDDYGSTLYGYKYILYGIFNKRIDVDFCSLDCLKKYVNDLK